LGWLRKRKFGEKYYMKIIFCLTGKNFSGKFLDCWTNLLAYCMSNGIQVGVSRKESCNVYYVRNMCLGADVQRGRNQKPFDNQLDYDFTCWIDSDSLFTPQMLQRLINYNQDIVAGLQSFEGGNGFTCGKLDDEFFKQHGYMEYYTPESIEKAEFNEVGLLEVDYTGFGMVLIKKGVFENMEYPWFRPMWFDYGDIKDFSMEDVGFCINAKKAGFKIYVDPTIRVGHLKDFIY
jgi:hypothetical protein